MKYILYIIQWFSKWGCRPPRVLILKFASCIFLYHVKTTLTIKDDDPAISTAGLGVVSKANMVALLARRLPMVLQVNLISTETGISGFHACELQKN